VAPEDELCLLLAREQLPAQAQNRTLGLLASPLCWPLVLQRARRYDILPLLYGSLRTLGFAGVPNAVREELEKMLPQQNLWAASGSGSRPSV
jgi:hypothetical protein